MLLNLVSTMNASDGAHGAPYEKSKFETDATTIQTNPNRSDLALKQNFEHSFDSA